MAIKSRRMLSAFLFISASGIGRRRGARNRVSLAAVEMALVQTREASFGDERTRREKKQTAVSPMVDPWRLERSDRHLSPHGNFLIWIFLSGNQQRLDQPCDYFF